ncbi:MAG: HAD family hydrolase [Proteobacteria bacterium]|nr:HAD family hydrolase [Pseudomonadota bacterium]
MYKNIKVIGFDADDTLWVNETYFREAELEFGQLLQQYETINQIDQELFKIEIGNLPIYGYGVKGFVLSMVEAALKISNHQISNKNLDAIIGIGKNMLNKPVELLDGVVETLQTLSKTHRLIMATKGDLLDQERKLEKSGLLKYFHHIEVMSDKKPSDYEKLLSHLDIQPHEFLMVGNSLKSDILPLVELGAHAVHVPFHTTWQHELVCQSEIQDLDYRTVDNITDIIKFIL